MFAAVRRVFRERRRLARVLTVELLFTATVVHS